MNRKTIVTIICIIILPVIFLGIRHKLGIVKISSAVAKHKQIDIDVLIKNTESQETYYPLTGQTVISGEIEVVVEVPSNDEAYKYVEYKINGFNYDPGYLPSYAVKIDTNRLPDGWNQLLVIGYNAEEKLEGVKQVIFKVGNNNNNNIRASRQGEKYDVGEKPSYKREYIPVLMYHDFQEDISKEQESAVVNPVLFEEQLEMLLENEYTPINFNDLYLYINGKGGLPKKPFIITADDGYLSNYETAFPILKKHNIPATFFVTTRYVGVDTSRPHFTWEQAKEMEESGLIDIQSHTHGHLLLNTIPDDEMRHQVSASFGIIEKNLGERDVKVLAYPQFYHNSHTKEILAEEGVDLQITRVAKRYKPTTKPTNIQRIHVANDTSPEDLIKEIEKLTQ